MKDFWNDIKELWSLWLVIVLFLIVMAGIVYAGGTANQIILERHGYHMHWFQASLVNVEELLQDTDHDLNVQMK